MIDGWIEHTLKSAPLHIMDGDRGKNYPKKTEFTPEGYCLFLNTKNVTTTGFAFDELNFINEERDELLRNGRLKRHDLVLTTRGTIGNIAYFHDKIPFDHIRINSGMVIIRPNGIDPDFNHQLFKHLKADFGIFTTGSAQPQLPVRDLHQISFFLPPLAEQKAIAGVLSSLDDKIDLLHRQNKTLEALAETLFRQWFIEEGQNDWEEGTIGDFISVQGGFAFKSKDFQDTGTNQVLKIKNISENAVDLVNADFIPDSIALQTDPKFLVRSGSVLLAMTGAKIGKLALVGKTDKKFWLNQRVALFTSENNAANYLAYLLFRSEFGQNYVKNTGSGSAQPNISARQIENCNFPKLTQNEVKSYSAQLLPFFEKLIHNLGQIQTLEKLRDTLLPKLMSGEVRVEV